MATLWNGDGRNLAAARSALTGLVFSKGRLGNGCG